MAQPTDADAPTDSPSAFDADLFLRQVSTSPGIYQMYDAGGNILYVGKAKNLKKRLSSYFRKAGLTLKTQALVEKIASIEVTITASESAALILEQSLIKSQRPPYNILLRDDKSYPYIFISSDTYPRIGMHRGAKRKKGEYFGPFPSAGSVYDTLNFIQKTFRVRQCEDSVFKNRSRPCLQYQINRCTAPCVKLISPEDYQHDMQHAKLFLKGDNQQLMSTLADDMESVSKALDFEQAAIYRDQIAALRRIQADHDNEAAQGTVDIFAIAEKNATFCVHVLFVRQGRMIGSKSYFSQNKLQQTIDDFLLAFLAQFYLASDSREIPGDIIVSQELVPHDRDVLISALQDRDRAAKAIPTAKARKVSINHNVRTQRKQWLTQALFTAEENLSNHINTRKNIFQRFSALQDTLKLEETPARLECFDISHSSGELTVASCVVFDHSGALKSDYRRFNIDGITPGDDYAAMAQALERRYTRLQKGEGKQPDILIIDGGKGQVSKAREVLAELGVVGVMLIGIAKGTTRKPGFETLVTEDGAEQVLTSDSPALHLLQEIRDEAHRFAVTGHQQRRDKKRRTSTLESIPGVGAKRRRELLRHFGGLDAVRRASITELAKVSGISKKMAEDIYSALRNE